MQVPNVTKKFMPVKSWIHAATPLSKLKLPIARSAGPGQTLEAGEPAETIFVMPAQSLPKNFWGPGRHAPGA